MGASEPMRALSRMAYFTPDIVGEATGESGRQVQRYIRLTKLSPELLQMVDTGKVAIPSAVELSYLKPEEQAMPITTIDY